jgi:hypothetical protein
MQMRAGGPPASACVHASVAVCAKGGTNRKAPICLEHVSGGKQFIEQALPHLVFFFGRGNDLRWHETQQFVEIGKDYWRPDHPGIFQQIHRHRERLSACLDDGHKGNFEMRNCCIEFLGDRWSTEIGDDKARETCECFDSFCIIAALWPRKVEDDWQVVRFSQSGCHRLQNAPATTHRVQSLR